MPWGCDVPQNVCALVFSNNPMTLTQPLNNHHKHCDDLFATTEEAAGRGDWSSCATRFNRFHKEMEAHFSTEEQVLFPTFESVTGITAGPTRMMRFEHTQMRELFDQMSTALQTKDRNEFAGVAETLLILMQQHNMKEENMLYPMCDRALSAQPPNVDGELCQRLQEVEQACLV